MNLTIKKYSQISSTIIVQVPTTISFGESLISYYIKWTYIILAPLVLVIDT